MARTLAQALTAQYRHIAARAESLPETATDAEVDAAYAPLFRLIDRVRLTYGGSIFAEIFMIARGQEPYR